MLNKRACLLSFISNDLDSNVACARTIKAGFHKRISTSMSIISRKASEDSHDISISISTRRTNTSRFSCAYAVLMSLVSSEN